jgi:hypothetical protein
MTEPPDSKSPLDDILEKVRLSFRGLPRTLSRPLSVVLLALVVVAWGVEKYLEEKVKQWSVQASSSPALSAPPAAVAAGSVRPEATETRDWPARTQPAEATPRQAHPAIDAPAATQAERANSRPTTAASSGQLNPPMPQQLLERPSSIKKSQDDTRPQRAPVLRIRYLGECKAGAFDVAKLEGFIRTAAASMPTDQSIDIHLVGGVTHQVDSGPGDAAKATARFTVCTQHSTCPDIERACANSCTFAAQGSYAGNAEAATRRLGSRIASAIDLLIAGSQTYGAGDLCGQ